MNLTKSLSLRSGATPIKQGVRYSFLLIFLLITHFCARAQQFIPKWVEDLGNTSSGYSNPTNLVVDNKNNIYVTGYFYGIVDFDPSSGVKNLSSGNVSGIFVGKYRPDGTLIWVGAFTGIGTNFNRPNGIAVDKDGNVSVTGSFDSDTLYVYPGPDVHKLINTTPAADNLFVINLDANGSFLWAHSIGGPKGVIGSESGNGVAADSHDNVIVTGSFTSPVTIGDSTYTPPKNSRFGLIVKYSPAGNMLWSVVLGNLQAAQTENAVGCKVDSQDNILVSGVFGATVNFNPLGSAYNLTANSNNGATFLAKYSPSGIVTWANVIRGPGISYLSKLGTDPQNYVYFSTNFVQSITFNSSNTLNSNSQQDVCFAKYSPAGVFQFAKSTQATASSADGVYNMTIDKNSNIYLTGYLVGTSNFNPNAGNPENLSYHGKTDLFLAKYDLNGNYIDAFGYGSPNCFGTNGNDIGVDNNGNVDVAGEFCSTVNFDPSGCSPVNLTASSSVGTDGFIAQYSFGIITNNVITAPSVASFCTSGTPAAITGSTPSGGSGAYTYQWRISTDSLNFTSIPKADSINYTPPPITATTYYRRIVLANCATLSVSNIVALHVSSPPDTPQAAGDTVCTGATAMLSIISPQPGLTYKWYTAATGDTSLFTGVSFTTPALGGTTTYYAEADNAGCSSATRTPVTVTILPPLSAPVVTVGAITGTSISFEWTAVPGATGYQVSIDSGKTFSSPSSGANGLTTIVSNLQPGSSITLIVEAIGGVACQLSASSAPVTAIIPKNDLIYVPNAFTPNGDGKNDMVHVHSESIQSMTFYIYDPWGELIFTSNDMQNGWDGTYKGTKEPVGVYVYFLQAIMIDGKKVDKKGTITLLR